MGRSKGLTLKYSRRRFFQVFQLPCGVLSVAAGTEKILIAGFLFLPPLKSHTWEELGKNQLWTVLEV